MTPTPTLSDETIERITAIMMAPVEPGDAQVEFPRKEREMLLLIQGLSPFEAFALKKRLAIGTETDPVVMLFARFSVERRDRLIALLRDPGRPDRVIP